MTKIDIISGFLGAGKTTLIKKLIAEAFQGEKLVLIENEFGEIGIDGGFLKDSGINITEMNSGCICCSLVGDFGTALGEVLEKYSPDRIIIEPSGVGKLSDVIRAVLGVKEKLPEDSVKLNSFVTVADATKCKMYMKNFGEFYNNQIENAGTVVLSRTGKMKEEKLKVCLDLIREHNAEASVITTPWEEIDGKQILGAMEKTNDLAKELLEEEDVCPECGHHHHDGECDHDHHHHEHEHHHDHDGEGEHDHHHHEHEYHHDHDGEGEHDHHHEHEHHHHDGECSCGHDHEHGHHHHHADDVFTSIGIETAHKYTEEELGDILEKLADEEVKLGTVLRAKGIVAPTEGEWFHFDLVPGEYEIRRGSADYTGRICVIGAQLDEDGLKELFAAK
ncbi:MAG: GTP-binding protein [Roseburia sp.]|nr:GTP-binding protein [Roseburia sp.]